MPVGDSGMKSFLTDKDRSRLESLSMRYEASRRRWWLIPLCVLAVLWAAFGLLMFVSVQQAHVVATHSVPYNEVLYDQPANNWLRGTQAIVHYRFTFAMWGLVAAPLCVGALLAQRLYARVAVSFWRTVKYLMGAVEKPEIVGAAALAIAGGMRPPKRGRSWFARGASGSPLEVPPLGAEKRWRLYRRAKTDISSTCIRNSVVYVMCPLFCLLIAGAPVLLALKADLPWYFGYEMLAKGYQARQAYVISELIVTDYALRALFVTPFLAYFMVLMHFPVAAKRTLPPRLIAEMRRLDVLLWRRSRGMGSVKA